MKLRIVFIFAVCSYSLFGINEGQTQQHCVSALRIGAYDYIRSNVASAANSVVHNELCKAYNKFESDRSSGSVQVTYSVFDGAASFSRDQIESIGSMMCKSDYSSQTAERVTTHASAIINPAAMEAYRRCLELSEEGLKVEIDPREEDQGAVAITLSYLTIWPGRPKITGISLDPETEFNCDGTLWQLATKIPEDGAFELDQARSMLCTRVIHAQPVLVGSRPVFAKPATILVETEAGAIRYHLSGVPVAPGPEELAELRKQIIPVGAVIMTPNACPTEYFIDVTSQYDGRFIKADARSSGQPMVADADGSHGHNPNTHAHTVTGNIAEPSDGFREGGGGRRSPHIRSPITGTTNEVTHTHDGGAHTHSSVGFRLCQKIAGTVFAGQ